MVQSDPVWSSLKIRTDLYEQIAAVAEVEDRSVAKMVDLLLRSALSERGPATSSAAAAHQTEDASVKTQARRPRSKSPAPATSSGEGSAAGAGVKEVQPDFK